MRSVGVVRPTVDCRRILRSFRNREPVFRDRDVVVKLDDVIPGGDLRTMFHATPITKILVHVDGFQIRVIATRHECDPVKPLPGSIGGVIVDDDVFVIRP